MNEKRVALLIETSTSWGTNLVKGIADYALTHENWFFRLVPTGKYERLTLPQGWDGDGIIARVTYEELAQQITDTGKPVVNVSWYSFDPAHIPSCMTDEVVAGRMIADHFFERGFKNFAYCGPMNRPGYTDIFGRAFVKTINEADTECFCFDEQGAGEVPLDWDARLNQLGDWIVKLPMPIAMLAFSSVGGRQIAEACRMKGLTIPDQVALMGGEHDELTCQITRPPLSSIDLSPQRVGWEAAAMLSRMLNGESPPKNPSSHSTSQNNHQTVHRHTRNRRPCVSEGTRIHRRERFSRDIGSRHTRFSTHLTTSIGTAFSKIPRPIPCHGDSTRSRRESEAITC